MHRRGKRLFTAVLLGSFAATSAAMAVNTTAGNKGEAAPDGATVAAAPLTVPANSSARNLLPITAGLLPTSVPGKAALESGLATVTLNHDGSVADTPASDAMRTLIDAQPANPPPPRAGRATRSVRGTATPVANGSEYPARAVGWLSAQDQNGQWLNCTASLVGPRTLVTAAHCVYDAQNGGWVKSVSFAPGAVDDKTAPFGQFDWDSIHIPKGFIDSTDTRNPGAQLPWDLAVITLQQDPGTQVGWLGFSVDDASAFDATVLGYPGGKPAGTLWTVTCSIPPSDGLLGPLFRTGCDPTAGSSGSPVIQDVGSGDLYIRGLTLAADGVDHYGLRLTGPAYQFILDHYQ